MKAFIIKATPTLTMINIPDIIFIYINWTIKPMNKKVQNILFLMENRKALYWKILVLNVSVDIQEIWFSYKTVRVPDTLKSMLDITIVLIDEAILYNKITIQTGDVLVKIHCCIGIKLETAYIISFQKEIRLFSFFSIFSIAKILFAKKKLSIHNPGC